MKSCLACNSTDLHDILDLGTQKPVNDLGLAGDTSERAPLALSICSPCGHGQLTEFLTPNRLFDDYLYASSTSQTLADYSHAFAEALAELSLDGPVLEIACNDGLQLAALRDAGIRGVGVDPASRMVERARSQGLDVLCDYWPEAAERFEDGVFEAVIGQNVFAHTPDPIGFLTSAKRVLRPEGLVLMQTSQADMLPNGEFDTVYHEHYSYFSERSAAACAERAGLRLERTVYSTIHGISAIFIMTRQERPAAAVRRADAFELSSKWSAEPGPSPRLRAQRKLVDWSQFAKSAQDRMNQGHAWVERNRSKGRRIVAVGAAAKGITFSRAAGLAFDVLLDEAPDKIGLEVDGLNVKISSLSDFQPRENDSFLFLAWNFRSELARKMISKGASLDSPSCSCFPNFSEGRLELVAC